MWKSRSIIVKSFWIIAFSTIFIFLLEANSLFELRHFFATRIIFLQGKRDLFCNILIGILGSTILTLFCEIIEYRNLEKALHSKILEISRDWEINVHYKLPVIFEKEQDIELFLHEIIAYWKPVSLIYMEYLPFFRGNEYVILIKNLYEFIYGIKKHYDQKEDIQNKMAYYRKKQKFIIENRFKIESDKVDNLIESYLKSFKSMEEVSRDRNPDAINFLKNINKKKLELDSALIYVNDLYDCIMENDASKEDFEYELEQLELSIVKIHWKEHLSYFKEILNKVRHPITTIHLRYLRHKYSKKS